MNRPTPLTYNASTLDWWKSSHSSENGACVEVAHVPGGVAVRDSKVPAGPHFAASASAFSALIGSVVDGTV
ncbi:DUF397 domain-containing protein [Streptomyces pseudovenezuelae]|uniref:DUF397 domain-containing protein n=1 Tax=Streptomyces pseudovenezuelae TaxID=67350 RepID=UPI0036E43213